MSSFTVLTNGQTLIVSSVTLPAGGTPTVYTSSALSTAVTFPQTISADTTYYYREAAVSVTVTQPDGSTLFSSVMANGDSISPRPSGDQVAADISTLSGTYAQLRIPITNPSGLNKWRVALANRRTTPVVIGVAGNSNWEGEGSTDYADRLLQVLQDRLRAQYQPPGIVGASRPYIKWPNLSPIPANPPYTIAGMADAGGSQYGLGGFGFKITSGGSVTISWVGDRAIVAYSKAGATAVLNTVLDGGTAVVTDTYYGSGTLRGTYDTGALSYGTHTLVISRDASSTGGRDIYLNGVYTYNGDYTAGIRVNDHSRYGTTADAFYTTQNAWLNTSSASGEFAATVARYSLLILGFGENDTARTQAQYQADLQGVIAAYRACGYAGSFLLVHGPRGQNISTTFWNQALAAEQAIAAADADVCSIDLSRSILGYNEGGNAMGYYYDSVHFNTAGQALRADAVLGVLTAA